jgi:hypothetical protein
MSSHKQVYLLNLLSQLHSTIDDESTKQSLRAQWDTVAHSAPEAVDLRWRPLYDLCRSRINDSSNPVHKKCFDIYQHGYEEYVSRFHT